MAQRKAQAGSDETREELPATRPTRSEGETHGTPGLGERLRGFLSSPPEEEAPGDEEASTRVKARAAHISGRERLYADVGGAVIGLGGAVALLNFVLLK
jgi:hypothetical protein